MQANKRGNLLVTYGYVTTKVWDIATGVCIKAVNNPATHPRPHTMLFAEKRNMVLACDEDRCTRSLSLDEDAAEEWTAYSQIDEQSLKDTFVNFPVCSSLSPDGNMISFGYRSHPATVWELEPPMLVGQCKFRLDKMDMTIEEYTWGEVFKLAWYLCSGEVFGLTQVGLLFRWNPYEEETSAKVHSGAHSLTINDDGSLIATGDAFGTIKIYAAADFSVLYQWASQDLVLYLSFSCDSRRLYDIRGYHGSAWEPNTLVRLAEGSDDNSESYSETKSPGMNSLHKEYYSAGPDKVIALSGQSIGPLYCYGTEDGVANLCEVGRDKVCELERMTSYMSIEHVAWSEDGHLVALAALSGRLAIKRVDRPAENHSWQATPEFDLIIPLEQGRISQILFHPTGCKLFVSTPATLFSVDLNSRALTESTLKTAISEVKWAWHPIMTDILLGFGNNEVHVFNWTDLRELEVSYFPLRLGRDTTAPLPPSSRRHTVNIHENPETVGRLITNLDPPPILLEISLPIASGHMESQYLLFDLSDWRPGTSSKESDQNSHVLPYTLIPEEIVCRIREPLAFLSRGRLIFLDVSHWICTWRLPSSVPPRALAATTTEASVTGIERYYFLPGDWVTGNETYLCTVMPDGTLLCPRNGDVAVEQAAKIRV